ncbi:MAG: ABC transporter substrate-binding protein [Clostridia bacterium]|nr:ABC transporter substrate-binding protein [Clostridia bacterium]
MKKIIALAAAVLLSLTLLAGCAGEPAPESSAPVSSAPAYEPVDINITAIAGPTGVGLVDLMQKQADKTAANNYAFNVVSDPAQAVAAISNGSADIAAVPTNLASTLYKKTGGKVQVLAVNTLGVLHILENGESISSVADLKGKTIYTSGQGANPEYILKYVLEKNNIDPAKDVTIEFVNDNDTLATLVANGTAKVAMVPEPKASACLIQNKALRRALNMTEEWNKVGGGDASLMMGCVVARTAFVQENPEAVAKFLEEYKASINAVVADVDTASQQCVTFGIIPKAPIAKQAIPNCGLTYVDGSGMKTALSAYLTILHSYNPAAIGGALPADDFYYVG